VEPQNTRNELRLFISSTFHDLQEERGYLIKHVFPQLRALCRQRGIEFTEIDLRWGLTAEESTLGKVIRTCLEEIDNCKPYFLGLLGDRYGWVPQLSEVQKDYQLLHKYPWVEDAALDGASLVEIEFMLGLRVEEGLPPGSFVYTGKYHQPAKGEVEKLAKLRELIVRSGRPLRVFESIEELGELVLKDFTAVIERDWPSDSVLSHLSLERRLHEVFGATRRKAYIANPKYIKQLDEHVSGDGPPLCIHGTSGAGKSALIAYFGNHHQKNHPDQFTITHFVGASPSAVDAAAVLRHILLEIRERFQIVEEVPETKEELIECLPRWLAGITNERIVIFIDAVNQLVTPDFGLGWLPEYLPPNVRLTVSTTTGEHLAALQPLGYREMHLNPMEGEEREALIVRFLGEYHKGLSREQLKKVASDQKASSPLFLRTLLEELRLSGEFELLDATLDHYQTAKDINELFQLVLERMESDYGVDLVSRVMSFIAHSRQGLSEPELIELLQCDRFSLSVFLLALDYHLMKPNGRYSFFHDYLRHAVLRRYLRNPAIARERHKALARYFASQPISRRRIEEEPWQWMKSGVRTELLESISSLEALELFVKYDKIYELLGYWNHLDLKPSDYISPAREALRESEDKQRYASLLFEMGKVFVTASFYGEAETLLREALAIRIGISGQEDSEAAKILSELGALCQQTARYDEAEKLLRHSFGIIERNYGPDHLLAAEASSNLATLLYLLRNFEDAEKLFRRSHQIFEKLLGPSDPRTIDTLTDLGSILWEEGQTQEAKSLYQHALALSRRYLGVTHPSSGQLLNNLGAVAQVEGDYEEAARKFKEAASVSELTFGPNSSRTVQTLVNVALVDRHLKRNEESEEIYRRIIPKMEELFGPFHTSVLKARNNFAMLLIDKNELDEADTQLSEVMSLRERVDGPESLDTIQAHLNYAKLLIAKNALHDAKDIYEQFLPKKIMLLGENHPSVLHTKREFEVVIKSNP